MQAGNKVFETQYPILKCLYDLAFSPFQGKGTRFTSLSQAEGTIYDFNANSRSSQVLAKGPKVPTIFTLPE